MFVGDGLAVGRAKAMRRAGTNQPYGKSYTHFFGDWLRERPWAERIDKGTRSVLLWVIDHRSEVEAWRETLAQSERDKLNHPVTLRRKYDAAHKVAAKDPMAPRKETKVEALVRENEELRAENKRLKQDGGSLFDCNKTPLKLIAKIMGEEMGLDRLTSAQKEIAKEIAALKARRSAAAG